MAEKANVTKEDILLKMRLLAEGVRYEVKGPLLWESTDKFVDVTFSFDHCDLVAETRANLRSRLKVSIDGNAVIVSEMGDVLATATLVPQAPWRDALLSDGTKVDDATRGMNGVSYINTFNRCFAYDSGQGCNFCAFGPLTALSGPLLSMDGILQSAARSIEATTIAIENGLRYVLIIGGAAPPAQRDRWTTDLLEGIMGRFRDALDEDLFSQVKFQPSVYPPDDLGEFYRWKDLGINSVEMDCQVMDPAYFKAICPGRGDQKYWFKAQEAAVEVFGRYVGCTSSVLLGLEPMAGMLEGIEERTAKGVSITPLIFKPWAGSAMEHMQPATAEWYVKAFDKINEIRSRYGIPYGLGYDPTDQADLSSQHNGSQKTVL